MSNYRIVTNGATYRVQYLEHHRFLWWTWDTWEFLRRTNCDGDWIAEFYYRTEANEAIEEMEHRKQLAANGWTPIEEGKS